jgi:hypothetical protein
MDLQFIGIQYLDKFSNRELTTVCNGIGAAWFSHSTREITNWVFREIKATAFLHDIEFELQIGFDIANAHFLINGRKEVKAKYKWYNPLRYLKLRKVKAAYLTLEYFGKTAYKDAGLKNKKSKTKKKKQKGVS